MEKEFKQLEIGDKWRGFEVGKAYKHRCDYYLVFCGVDNYKVPFFEHFDNKCGVDKEFLSIIGIKRYYCYTGLEREFDPLTETDPSNIDKNGKLKEVDESTFKVGDKVVVNDYRDGWFHFFNSGDVCKIIAVRNLYYKLERLSDGLDQTLSKNQFDKYVEDDYNVSSPFVKGSNEGWIGEKVKVIDRGHQYKTHPLLAHLKKAKEPLENDWIVVVKDSILINDGTRECFIVEDHTGKEHIIEVDGVESYFKQRTLESVAHKHNLGNYIYIFQDGYRWIVELSSGIAISKGEYKTGVIPREIKIKDNNTIRAATLDEIFRLKVSEYFQEYISDPEFKVSEYLRKKGLTGEVVIKDYFFIHNGIYVARMIKNDDNYSFVVKDAAIRELKTGDGVNINDDKVELKTETMTNKEKYKNGDFGEYVYIVSASDNKFIINLELGHGLYIDQMYNESGYSSNSIDDSDKKVRAATIIEIMKLEICRYFDAYFDDPIEEMIKHLKDEFGVTTRCSEKYGFLDNNNKVIARLVGDQMSSFKLKIFEEKIEDEPEINSKFEVGTEVIYARKCHLGASDEYIGELGEVTESIYNDELSHRVTFKDGSSYWIANDCLELYIEPSGLDVLSKEDLNNAITVDHDTGMINPIVKECVDSEISVLYDKETRDKINELKSEIEFKEGDRVIYYKRDSNIPTSDCLGMVGVVNISGFRPLVRFSNGMSISIDSDCLKKTDPPFRTSATKGAGIHAFIEGAFDSSPLKLQNRLDEIQKEINKGFYEDPDDNIVPVKRRYIRKKK